MKDLVCIHWSICQLTSGQLASELLANGSPGIHGPPWLWTSSCTLNLCCVASSPCTLWLSSFITTITTHTPTLIYLHSLVHILIFLSILIFPFLKNKTILNILDLLTMNLLSCTPRLCCTERAHVHSPFGHIPTRGTSVTHKAFLAPVLILFFTCSCILLSLLGCMLSRVYRGWKLNNNKNVTLSLKLLKII